MSSSYLEKAEQFEKGEVIGEALKNDYLSTVQKNDYLSTVLSLSCNIVTMGQVSTFKIRLCLMVLHFLYFPFDFLFF
jgi:hypothetical protein